MTKRKTAPAAERVGASAFDIDGLLAMNQRSIDAMTRMNTRIYQNMMRVHTELLEFTSRRLRADLEVAQKLTGAGKLDDVVEAVYGFQRQIISDYAAEASELVKMSTSMAGDLIQEIEDDVKEGAGEVEIDVTNANYVFQLKMRKIISDYADEASELVKMSTSMAEDLIQEVEDDVKKVVGEVAGAVTAEGAPPEPQAAETGEEVAARGPVITLKGPPKKTGEPDLQQVVLDVLSGSDKAISLAEIARQIGKEHFASLIGPMRSLRKMGRVVKEEKVYRLAGGASPR